MDEEMEEVEAAAWRIIPFNKWLVNMVIISPLSRVVGPLPNGLNGLEIWVTNLLTASLPLKIGKGPQKETTGSIPTIHFQVRKCSFQGFEESNVYPEKNRNDVGVIPETQMLHGTGK